MEYTIKMCCGNSNVKQVDAIQRFQWSSHHIGSSLFGFQDIIDTGESSASLKPIKILKKSFNLTLEMDSYPLQSDNVFFFHFFTGKWMNHVFFDQLLVAFTGDDIASEIQTEFKWNVGKKEGNE